MNLSLDKRGTCTWTLPLYFFPVLDIHQYVASFIEYVLGSHALAWCPFSSLRLRNTRKGKFAYLPPILFIQKDNYDVFVLPRLSAQKLPILWFSSLNDADVNNDEIKPGLVVEGNAQKNTTFLKCTKGSAIHTTCLPSRPNQNLINTNVFIFFIFQK